MGKVAIGLVVAANLIALAPHAKADENSFLADLGQHGIFTVRDPGVLVNFGRGICADLAKGVSIPDEVDRASGPRNSLPNPHLLRLRRSSTQPTKICAPTQRDGAYDVK